MQVNHIDIEYKANNEEFNFFIASDSHIGHIDFDRDRFLSDMEIAKRKNAKIILNGDILDLITVRDAKRYRKSGDRYPGIDALVNKQIEDAAAILEPYAKNIVMIGVGNHEGTYVHWNGYDPISGLITLLNMKTGSQIRHGGYEGFIVIRLYRENKGEQGAIKRYTIFYNHGQGGSSEITKGTIDLSRRSYINADLIVLGHKHTKIMESLSPEIGVDRSGNIYEREKKGLITGCYIKNIRITDPDKNGYQPDFRAEKCRVPQAHGGALLTLWVQSIGRNTEIKSSLTTY